MTVFSKIYKNLLLVFVFLVMFIPLLQNQFNFFEIPKLKGDVQQLEKGEFSKENWFSNLYQEKQEKFLNESFGLRNLFIRLNNQIDFSLFKKANAKDVIIGKNNYLYEINYIKAYTGEDFIGKDSINRSVERIKFLSDTLKKLNKNFIFMFAPGKASFYPEFIPDKYLMHKNTITNYQYYAEALSKAGVDVMDYKKWFLANKGKTQYPLYPQQGVHWSTYGTTFVIDSLEKKIEYLRNIKMPHVTWNSFRINPAYEIDYDVADGMNLLFKIKGFDCAYPNLNPIDSSNKTKPKILVIGDSFYWGIYYLGIANCFDKDHKFWYYNKQIYPESFEKDYLVESVNLLEEVLKNDIIMVVATDNNLRNVGWGFFENTYKAFKGINKTNANPQKVYTPEYWKKVKDYVGYIKTQDYWMRDAVKRAKEKNISLDSCLVLEAMWQVDLEAKK